MLQRFFRKQTREVIAKSMLCLFFCKQVDYFLLGQEMGNNLCSTWLWQAIKCSLQQYIIHTGKGLIYAEDAACQVLDWQQANMVSETFVILLCSPPCPIWAYRSESLISRGSLNMCVHLSFPCIAFHILPAGHSKQLTKHFWNHFRLNTLLTTS